LNCCQWHLHANSALHEKSTAAKIDAGDPVVEGAAELQRLKVANFCAVIVPNS
jgi:hypothetical protein